MEIIDFKNHPAGGQIVTVERRSGGRWFFGLLGSDSKSAKCQYLRRRAFHWFAWPSIDKLSAGMCLELEKSLEEFNLRNTYVKTRGEHQELDHEVEALPKGGPTRCMFCHTDMSGMSAQCPECGGSMHLSCANENDDSCITPGCRK